MKEEQKRWVPIHIPNGPFMGSVTLKISGDNVMSADAAKEMIDTLESRYENTCDCNGCTCGKGKAQVPESR